MMHKEKMTKRTKNVKKGEGDDMSIIPWEWRQASAGKISSEFPAS